MYLILLLILFAVIVFAAPWGVVIMRDFITEVKSVFAEEVKK